MDNTKTLIQGVDFTFDASAQTVTFAGFTPVQAQILVISNVTDNIIIYSSSQPATKGVLSGQVLTLTYDTTTMADSDNLQVRYASTDAQPISAAALPLPTGAATAALQTTGNTALSAIQTAVQLIDNAIAGAEMQVDIVTSALPTGAATSALQTTGNTALSAIQTAVQLIDNAIAGNEMQVDIVAALPAGTNLIGQVNVAPQTTGGLSLFRSIDLDETEEEIKGTAGQVYGWFIYNNAATVLYVKFYNATAANVTVGTTTPVLTIPIPAGSGANVEYTNGIAFSTAITIAATTGVADNNTGAPAANDIIANIFYK